MGKLSLDRLETRTSGILKCRAQVFGNKHAIVDKVQTGTQETRKTILWGAYKPSEPVSGGTIYRYKETQGTKPLQKDPLTRKSTGAQAPGTGELKHSQQVVLNPQA